MLWSVAAIGHGWAVGIGSISTDRLAVIRALVAVLTRSVRSSGLHRGRSRCLLRLRVLWPYDFCLGSANPGNFPASIKTVSEWFPKKERALATGIFNAGTNVGAWLTPLLVPVIVLAWGWYEAFIFTGILGFIWLLFWLDL